MYEPSPEQGRLNSPTRAQECPVCGGVGLTPVTVKGVPPLLRCSDCGPTFRRDTTGGVSVKRLDDAELGRLEQSRNTLWDLLDQLEHPMPALREAWRVLRPGGLLHVRIRNDPIHMALRRSILIPAAASVFHTLLFSPTSLTTALRLAGLEDARVGCARLTTGNSCGEVSSSHESMLRAIKATWQAIFALVSVLTGRRVLLAPSIQAVGIRPQE